MSVYEPYEVAYWTRRFGCTVAQLEEAVKAVGGITADVEEWLRRSSTATAPESAPRE